MSCDAPGSPPRTTFYAPAGRDTPDEFRRKTGAIEGIPFLRQALDAMPNMVMILNANRQIVAVNETLLSLLHVTRGQVAEKRPGEAVGCIRAPQGPDGCGTARHCATCGAVGAIWDSQKDQKKVVRECRILVETPAGVGPLDLRVTATPFQAAGDRFILVAVEDVSQSKQLAVMQRLFFHDVLNTAGCISGYAQYFRESDGMDREGGELLVGLASQLIDAIQAHRDFLFAESGDLLVKLAPLGTTELLAEVRAQYEKHAVAEGRVMELKAAWDGAIISDRQLLKRVLGNMVKNALEATARGGTVTLSVDDHGGEVALAVHNPEVMPEEVQLQVFQRSFSTKGQSGRGIGTYSMKLFGERYLGGKVDFTSAPGRGTTFTLTVPKVTPS